MSVLKGAVSGNFSLAIALLGQKCFTESENIELRVVSLDNPNRTNDHS
ncbi:MAG: hypothetical protein V7L29_09195 [Nostoc sp.]